MQKVMDYFFYALKKITSKVFFSILINLGELGRYYSYLK